MKYGDPESKISNCLEFYRIVQRPGAYVGQYDNTTHGFLPEKRFVPGETYYVLVGKDYDGRKVKSVEALESHGNAAIVITREHRDLATQSRTQERYQLVYGQDFSMFRDS